MALRDTWVDKVDEQDDVVAEDINNIARAVIDVENKIEKEIPEYVDENIKEVNQSIDDIKDELEERTSALDEKTDKLQSDTELAIYDIKNQYSNALKGSVRGYSVRVDDVSPVEHDLGVKLVSKNILNPNTRITPKTQYGLTIQYLPDEDCYLLNGEASSPYSVYYKVDIPDVPLEGERISISLKVLSGCIEKPDGAYAVFYVGGKNNVNEPIGNWSAVGLSEDNTAIPSTTRKYLSSTWFYISSGVVVDNLKVQIQIEKGTTATEYTPYIDVSTPILSTLGKNIFPPKALDISNYTIIKENAYERACEYILPTMNAGKVYLSAKSIADTTVDHVGYFYLSKKPLDGSADWTIDTYIIQGEPRILQNVLTIEAGYQYRFWVYSSVPTVFPLDYFENIQLEIGESATEYESPIEPTTYTPNADGTVEGVKSIYPNTTLLTDTQGVLIDCEYNRDTNKVIEKLTNAIISLGGNV